MSMIVTPLSLPGLKLFKPRVFSDERGMLIVRYAQEHLKRHGIPSTFSQFNHSRSTRGTLRGLHFQAGAHAQGKLVGIIRGIVIDVVLDLRRSSPTFGQAEAVLLDDVSGRQLWVPRGFAHGFLTLSDTADMCYHIDNDYAPDYEAGIRWDDRAVKPLWNLHEFGLSEDELIISAKDIQLPHFSPTSEYFS